jgi:hypothetical protein
LDHYTSVGAQLFGTSAKLNRGVEQAFLDIGKRLVARKAAQPRGTGGMGGGRGRGSNLIIVDKKPRAAKEQECC